MEHKGELMDHENMCLLLIFLTIHAFLSKVHKSHRSLFKAPGLYLLDSLHPEGKSQPSSEAVLVKTEQCVCENRFPDTLPLESCILANGKWPPPGRGRRIKARVWASLVWSLQHVRAEMRPVRSLHVPGPLRHWCWTSQQTLQT